MWPTESHPEHGADRGDRSAPSADPPGRAARPTIEASPADDAALLARIATGDEHALGTLYDRWAGTVHALAQRIVGEESEADDVVEATFWQVWRQAARYEPARGTVAAWLVTVARSRALDRRRARARLREDQEPESGTFADVAAADGASPLDAAESADRRRIVRAALAALPGDQREALELAYYAGLTQTEIAERTGTPLGTVKTRMRLALRKLRDGLGGLAEVLS